MPGTAAWAVRTCERPSAAISERASAAKELLRRILVSGVMARSP